jgi:hypothetical protein
MNAARRDATGHAMGHRRFLAGRKALVFQRHARQRLNAGEGVGKRLDPVATQTLKLCAPRGEQLREPVVFPAHPGQAT